MAGQPRRKHTLSPPTVPLASREQASAADKRLNYFEIMRRVGELLPPDEESYDDLTRALLNLNEDMNAKVEAAGPVPRMLREALENLSSMVRAIADQKFEIFEQVPLEQRMNIHPILELLLHENFEHLERQFGRPLAEREFKQVFDSLIGPRRKRGRPQKFDLATIQQAKALRDKRWTYERVGRKLGMTGVQVRTMLQHHFPKE